jgi:tetratricopeptide (TPR) repeat protein
MPIHVALADGLPTGVSDNDISRPSVSKATFENGVRLYQEKHYPEAFDVFKSLYESGRDFAALHYNWGLTAYQLQKKGLAAGLWRRALFLDPELGPASRALSLVSNELPHSWSDEASLWSQLRSSVLSKVSFNKLAFVAWLFFVLGGFLFIRYLGQRKHALTEELSLPPFPAVAAVFVAAAVVTIALTLAKFVAVNEISATVVTAAAIRTGPSAQDNAIFDLLEGLEVFVRGTQKGWVQVSLRSGQIGWIQMENLFQSTGNRRLW